MSLMDKLATERRARLAAERMLDLRSQELFEANRKLSYHARALSDRVVAQQANILSIRSKAEELQTKNTEAEATLAVVQEEATTSHERLGNALEVVEDGIALFDGTDTLVTSNRAWVSLFEDLTDVRPGITYTEVLHLGTEEGVFDTGDMTQQQWVEHMLDLWDSDQIPETTLKIWNGRSFRFNASRAENGDKLSRLVDITDQIMRENEMAEAREFAEAAARAKAAFLANMSHELRTPMNGVVGMADLLRESTLDAEQLLYVDTIRSSGQVLLTIINDVLDFSKLEAENMTLYPEPFDLERLVQEMVMLMRPTAKDKDLDIAIDYDMFLPTGVVGDPGRIRQILTNLIGNAIKFTSAGHVLVRIVGFQDDATNSVTLHIAVEDTGIGIPKNKLDDIFGEFNQVENERNRKFDGTGLGLAITKELVNLMDGEIWVQSEEGEGSNFGFRVELPLDGEPIPVPRAIADSLHSVLLVDSGKLDSTIMAKQLQQLQLKVETVRTGSDALKILGPNARYDLLVIDQKLHDTLGLNLVASLRDLGVDQPVLLLAQNPEMLARDPMAESVQAFLRRPFARAELFETLADLSEVDIVSQTAPSSKVTDPPAVDEPEETIGEPAPAAFMSLRAPTPPPDPAPVPEDAAPEPDDTPEIDPEPAVPAFSAIRREPAPAASDPAGPKSVLLKRSAAPEPEPEPKPADPEPAVFSAIRRGAAPVQPATPSGPKMRVLAAEDNRTNQLVFRKMVKNLNIDLQIVDNGRLAVEAFESFQPHLVFMDISMPEVDGKQATQQIRWMEDAGRKVPADVPKRVPIIAMTAHAMSGDEDLILSAGLDSYLTKPLKKDAIIQKILENKPSGCIAPDAESSAT
jgi:signal transduction histidine kinase/CheY-like chemotaxis protein